MRTVLLTGGNRGLGFATAGRLAEAGHRVVITARSQAKVDAAVAVLGHGVEGRVVDLASQASIRTFAASLRHDELEIDVLVHNAGMLFPPPTTQLNEDGVEVVLFVNAVAPLLLTELLLPALRRPGRVVALGSSLHEPGSRGEPVDFRFDDPFMRAHYHPQRAYKNSKLALVWVMTELDRRLRDDGIRCDVICPGFVPTTAAAGVAGFKRFVMRRVLPHMPFATSLEESSTNLARLFGGDDLDGGGGRYFKRWQEASPSPDALDAAKARRFVELAHGWLD